MIGLRVNDRTLFPECEEKRSRTGYLILEESGVCQEGTIIAPDSPER